MTITIALTIAMIANLIAIGLSIRTIIVIRRLHERLLTDAMRQWDEQPARRTYYEPALARMDIGH